MSDIVVHVEHLSKEYRLGVIGHGTLYQDLQSWWARRTGRDDPNSQLSATGAAMNASSPTGTLLALNDVSFQVRRGETLAVIGANGAGKSTLFKILSRITTPTRGRIVYEDRVASLLEVGAGFHEEMTGRQNVYLNGAILGMRQKEITRKFDRIVDFADVDRFIDTPVKRYSSGMYVRLAFSVAAHLDAEILLVDEVLAVGDIGFQKKCIEKLREITQNEGRTVLFVSHNMDSVRNLCRRAIVLEHGKLRLDTTDVDEAIRRYRSPDGRAGAAQWVRRDDDPSDRSFRPCRAALVDAEGRIIDTPVGPEDEIRLLVEGDVETPDPELGVGYTLYSDGETPIYCSYNYDTLFAGRFVPLTGNVVFSSRLPLELLNIGVYHLELNLRYGAGHYNIGRRLSFELERTTAASPYWIGRRAGECAPVIPWEIRSGTFEEPD